MHRRLIILMAALAFTGAACASQIAPAPDPAPPAEPPAVVVPPAPEIHDPVPPVP